MAERKRARPAPVLWIVYALHTKPKMHWEKITEYPVGKEEAANLVHQEWAQGRRARRVATREAVAAA
jgi:hypothetical protein